MKGKKKTIGEIKSRMKHLRENELRELVKLIDDKYPCSELSKKVHAVEEIAGDIATDIENFKEKT